MPRTESKRIANSKKLLVLGLLRKSTNGIKHTKERLQRDSSDKDGVLAKSEETCTISCSSNPGGYCVLKSVDCQDASVVEPHKSGTVTSKPAPGPNKGTTNADVRKLENDILKPRNTTTGRTTKSTMDAGSVGEMQIKTRYQANLALAREARKPGQMGDPAASLQQLVIEDLAVSEHKVRPVRMGLSEDRCEITNDIARKVLHWTGDEPLLDTSELQALLVEESHLDKLPVLSQAMECDSLHARHYHEQTKLLRSRGEVSERALHRFLSSLSASVAEGEEEPAKLLFDTFMDRGEPETLRAHALFALIPPQGRPAAPLHTLSRLHNYVLQMSSSNVPDASVAAQAILVLGALARRHRLGAWGNETMAKAHEIIRLLQTELASCDSTATCTTLLVALGNTADLDSQQLIVPYLQHSDDPHVRCVHCTVHVLACIDVHCWWCLGSCVGVGLIRVFLVEPVHVRLHNTCSLVAHTTKILCRYAALTALESSDTLSEPVRTSLHQVPCCAARLAFE